MSIIDMLHVKRILAVAEDSALSGLPVSLLQRPCRDSKE
jgi:hypothetical protein